MFCENNSERPLSFPEMALNYNQSGFRVTMTSNMFWDPNNLQALFKKAQQHISNCQNAKVTLVPDTNFWNKASEIINNVLDNRDLKTINNHMLKVIIDLYSENIERQKLYTKWFIYNDRPRVLSYPRNTHGRHRVEGLSTYNYNSQNPSGRFHDDFVRGNRERFSEIKRPVLFDSFYC